VYPDRPGTTTEGRMDQQQNRRRWERFPFDASVRVVVDHSADDATVNGRGVRLSEGGICLFAAANLPVGSDIDVEFNNPRTDEPVRVRGKLRKRSVYLYGVEFLSDRFED
jgi:hypothetical protein